MERHRNNSFAHARNLRKGRRSIPAQAYLLTTATHLRKPMFMNFSYARCALLGMRYHDLRDDTRTLAGVVMPDHVHWLLYLTGRISMDSLMRQYKGGVARRIHAIRGIHAQRLWQAGYHDHAVRREEDMEQLVRYVIANPLRAGLVEQVEDYPHWHAAWL